VENSLAAFPPLMEQSIWFQIKWVRNTLKVLLGMDVTTGKSRAELTRQLAL
jgi:hypothetical protein